MLMRLRVAAAVAGLSLGAGCAHLKEPKINFKDEPSGAVILAGNPQVYARESLINLRRDDIAWVKSLLRETTEEGFRARFGADVARQVQVLTAIRASLGVGINSQAGRRASRQDELAALQHDIDLQRLENELLRARMENPVKPKTGEEGEAAPAAGDPPPDYEAPDAKAELGEIQSLIESLRTAMSTREPGAILANPRDQYRDMLAYREELNALLNELQLDDLHDADGSALYKLRIPVTVVPGATQDRYGRLNYTIEPPTEMTTAYYRDLYLRWLGHLTFRLNHGSNSADTAQLSDRELQFFGISSKLFVPSTFYVSTLSAAQDGTPRDALVDPCLGATSLVEAEAISFGCQPFRVALPFEIGTRLSSLFPRLEHLGIAILETDVYGTPLESATATDEQRILAAFPHVKASGIRDRIRARLPEQLHRLPMLEGAIFVAAIDFAADPGLRRKTCPSARSIDERADCIAGLIARSFRKSREEADVSADADEKKDPAFHAPIIHGQEPVADSTAIVRPRPVSAENQYMARVGSFGLPAELTTRLDQTAAGPILASRVAEATRISMDHLRSSLRMARTRLTPEQRGELMNRKALVETLVQVNGALPYLGPIAQGLSQRQDIGAVERVGAEQVLQTLVDLARVRQLIPDLRSDAGVAPPTLSDCSQSRRSIDLFYCKLRDTLLDGEGEQRVNIYSVAPSEVAQRVSMNSSAAEAISLAAALSVADPLGGRDMDAGASFGREIANQARSMERLPLVVGYAQGASHEFGWIFGPRQRVVAARVRDVVELSFPPASFEVTVDVAVPAWWESITLRQEADWLGNVSGASFSGSGRGEEVVVQLPGARRSLDSVTRVLAEPYGGAPPTARIVSVTPPDLNLCASGITLAIRGPDLWRGAEVGIAGVMAEVADVRVLPDMEGLLATFRTEHLRPALAGMQDSVVTVLTQNGVDSFPVRIDRAPAKDGGCQATAIGKSALVAIPDEVHMCDNSANLLLRLREPVGENSVTFYTDVGTVEGKCKDHIRSTTSGDGSTLPERCQNYSVGIAMDTSLLAGRSSFTVHAATSEGADAVQIRRVGDPKSCNKPGAPAPAVGPTIASIAVASADGSLRACSKEASLIIKGTSLDKIKSVAIFGVTGDAKASSDASDLRVVHFHNLPRLGDAEKPPADTVDVKVLLQDGKSVPDVTVPWVACGS